MGKIEVSATGLRERKLKARRQIDALEGRGPGGQLNFSYADGYAAEAIKREFGCDDIQKIKRWANTP